ncbi:MAG: gliding motility protein GldM [Bacteroidota bacterium]
MSGGKETPRQKMIGMMYLVLTALLALNVSKDILNAFIIVDESLIETNRTVQSKSDGIYSDFKKAMLENAQKAGPFNAKAMKVKKYTEEMLAYVKQLRTDLIVKVEKVDPKVADTLSLEGIAGKDNYDITTQFLVGGDEVAGKGAKGEELKNKLEEFKKNLLDQIDEKKKKQMGNLGFDLEDKYNPHFGRKAPWNVNNFFHTIMAADMVIFNQISLQVKNAEAEVVSILKEGIYGADMPFDQIEARVIAKSNYVMTGENYEADIFVAASSSTMTPEILLQEGADSTTAAGFEKYKGSAKKLGTEPGSVVKGVVKYVAPGAGEGLKKYTGIINLKNPKTGAVTAYPFYSEYMVAKPAAVISAEKMNVFYIGLDNPLSVSVPGVASDNLSVTIAGGTLQKKGAGKFMVRVSQQGKVKVNVSAKFGNSSKAMGSMEYRVKKVPDPVPMVAGKKSGVIPKSQLQAAPFVVAVLEDFLFDGVSYKITGFKFSTVSGGIIEEAPCKGAAMDEKAKSILAKSRAGQKIYFEDIKAVGPDGSTRNLPSMIFKLI